ncbi:FixH family protein [Pseudomonas sp. PDM16]|uniref:FixH family protein n=1 Tax=Pseudomonas sp. PDM16 TaxID=2769292 RepID=UPI0017801665|nr:FixH family protein [Pseudomonas sp. PDM16]MBD9416588.1 FixH family protein [Pseudomonas sp. PDM16]
MSSQQDPVIPWYKVTWVWLILGILGMSVVLGTSMLVIATKNPPGLLSDNYYDVGKGINTSLEREELAQRLKLKADLVMDNEQGTATLHLQGYSNPPQLLLNLISPTQPDRDRRVVLQPQGDGSYTGNLLDAIEGRRFVELIGQEGGKDWRLFEEEQVASGQRIQLGE